MDSRDAGLSVKPLGMFNQKTGSSSTLVLGPSPIVVWPAQWVAQFVDRSWG